MAAQRSHRCHRKGSDLRGVRRGQLEAPKHLARTVHDLYFEPKYENFVRERSGACRMHSLRRSRNSIPSRNSERQPSWANSSEAVFTVVLGLSVVPAGPPLLIVLPFSVGRRLTLSPDPFSLLQISESRTYLSRGGILEGRAGSSDAPLRSTGAASLRDKCCMDGGNGWAKRRTFHWSVEARQFVTDHRQRIEKVGDYRGGNKERSS